jgi:serine protease
VSPGAYGVRVVGTQGTLTHYADVTLHVIAIPDFSVAVIPTTWTQAQGASASGAVTTSAIGAVGAVNLSAAITPAGPTAVLSPSTVAAGGVATLTVSAGYGVAPGTYTVTVTGTEGSISHATSVLVMVILKGIVNGGFETGDLTGWTQTGTTATVQLPHSGTFAGQMGSGSAFASANSTLAQTFTVPTSGGKLTFWYRTFCSDKVKNDWFTATLQDGVTGTISILQAPVCSKAGGWTKVTANVSAHAGHFVTVTFLNHDDGVALTPTFTVVDDVALT